MTTLLLIAFLGLVGGGFLMLSLVPFWHVMFRANFYKKQLNSELETALSIITTSYLRSENLIMAVEENVAYLNPPVCDVFKSFLAQTNLINGNIQLALENIKYHIASEVYHEWIDAVIACLRRTKHSKLRLPRLSLSCRICVWCRQNLIFCFTSR